MKKLIRKCLKKIFAPVIREVVRESMIETAALHKVRRGEHKVSMRIESLDASDEVISNPKP